MTVKGKTFLINGLLNTTHYFDKQIAGYQGISDRQQSSIGIKYPKKSKKYVPYIEGRKIKLLILFTKQPDMSQSIVWQNISQRL